jgi:hypothetical protein
MEPARARRVPGLPVGTAHGNGTFVCQSGGDAAASAGPIRRKAQIAGGRDRTSRGAKCRLLSGGLPEWWRPLSVKQRRVVA